MNFTTTHNKVVIELSFEEAKELRTFFLDMTEQLDEDCIEPTVAKIHHELDGFFGEPND